MSKEFGKIVLVLTVEVATLKTQTNKLNVLIVEWVSIKLAKVRRVPDNYKKELLAIVIRKTLRD